MNENDMNEMDALIREIVISSAPTPEYMSKFDEGDLYKEWNDFFYHHFSPFSRDHANE